LTHVLKRFLRKADEALAIFGWGEAEMDDPTDDPGDTFGGGVLGYLWRQGRQWFGMRPRDRAPIPLDNKFDGMQMFRHPVRVASLKWARFQLPAPLKGWSPLARGHKGQDMLESPSKWTRVVLDTDGYYRIYLRQKNGKWSADVGADSLDEVAAEAHLLEWSQAREAEKVWKSEGAFAGKLTLKKRVTGQTMDVALYEGSTKVGVLQATLFKRADKRCAPMVAALKAKHPETEAITQGLMVTWSHLDEHLKGKKAGTAMYQALMAVAFKALGPFFFMADSCGMSTSKAALRVWTALGRRYPFEGNVVAVLRAPTWDKSLKLAGGLKVYLDDERKTPPGWKRVFWPDEAIRLLKTNQVSEISLDHDLGDDRRGTGYDVVTWIEEAVVTQGFTPPIIRVHSANTSAARKMEQGIQQIYRLHKRFNKSARKVAARFFVEGTKSKAEKEDKEVERLNRRNPKHKPPRHDLRRNQMKEDDPDMEGFGADGDRDLSQNYKKRAVRSDAVVVLAGRKYKVLDNQGRSWSVQDAHGKKATLWFTSASKALTERSRAARVVLDPGDGDSVAYPIREFSFETPRGGWDAARGTWWKEGSPAHRVASRWVRHLMAKSKGKPHKPGEVWQAPSGVWVGASPKLDDNDQLVTHTFGKDDKGKEQATAFAKGLKDKGKDTDKGVEEKEKQDRKEKLKGDVAAFREELGTLIKGFLDGGSISKEVAAALELKAGDMKFFRAYRKEQRGLRKQLEEDGVSVESMKELSKDPFKDIDMNDVEALAEAVVQSKVRDKVLLDPMHLGGKPLSSEDQGSEARAGRAEQAMKLYRRVSPEQRIQVAERAAGELANLDPESPEAKELNAIIDGVQAACVLNGEPFDVMKAGGDRDTRDEDELAALEKELEKASDDQKKELEEDISALKKRIKRKEKASSQGGLLREPLSPKMNMVLQEMVNQGNAKFLFLDDPGKMYQAEGREAVRDALGNLDDAQLIDMGKDTAWSPLGDALGGAAGMKLDPEVKEMLRGMMRDMSVNSMCTTQGVAASITRGKSDPVNLSEAYDLVAKELEDAAKEDTNAACEDWLDACVGGESLTDNDCKAAAEAIPRTYFQRIWDAVLNREGDPPNLQDVPVAVVKNISEGADPSLADDKTLKPERPFGERKREFLEGITDPAERKRIEKMTPDEFAAMENAVVSGDDEEQAA
jgi:hypothetical protein